MADWDKNNPADDDIVSQYPANERAARGAVETNFAVDHHSTNDSDVGKHKLIHMLPQSTPLAAAGEGHFYTKDVGGGVIELFYQDENGDEVQLTKGTILNTFPTGTRMLFQQTAAPTGWTKDTAAGLDDTALRIVTGSVSSRTNQSAFSTVFGKTATDGHALTEAQLAVHDHPMSGVTTVSGGNYSYGNGSGGPRFMGNNTNSTSNAGSGQAHAHNMDIRVNYHDVIIAVAD